MTRKSAPDLEYMRCNAIQHSFERHKRGYGVAGGTNRLKGINNWDSFRLIGVQTGIKYQRCKIKKRHAVRLPVLRRLKGAGVVALAYIPTMNAVATGDAPIAVRIAD